MNIAAYFKGLTLTDAAEGDLYKLVFHVKKGQLLGDLDALMQINELQGRGVRLAVMEDTSTEYESPTEKRAREEREKYDQVMEEKRRREGLALELTPEEGEARAEQVAENLAKISEEPQEGYGAVYRDPDGGDVIWMAQVDRGLSDDNTVIFVVTQWASDGSFTARLEGTGEHATAEMAQVELDRIAEEEGLLLVHYRKLPEEIEDDDVVMFAPLPDLCPTCKKSFVDCGYKGPTPGEVTGCSEYEAAESQTEAIVDIDGVEAAREEAEQVLECPGTKYIRSDDGALVFVGQGLGAGKADSPWFTLYKRTPGLGSHRVKSKNLPVRETREEAQADLDAYATERKWKVFEMPEEEEPDLERATIERMMGATDTRPLSLRVGIGHQVARKTKPSNVGTIMDIAEESEKPFGIKWPDALLTSLDYISASALDQFYTDDLPAPVDESAAEAPEVVQEPTDADQDYVPPAEEPAPVEAKVDPFEEIPGHPQSPGPEDMGSLTDRAKAALAAGRGFYFKHPSAPTRYKVTAIRPDGDIEFVNITNGMIGNTRTGLFDKSYVQAEAPEDAVLSNA